MFGLQEIEGWFFSQTFHYYQRTNNRVVAYVSKYIGFYCLQVYERGQLGICDIEYRTEDFNHAIEKATEFLEKYKDKSKEDMWEDYYSPHNPSGYWQVVYQNRYKE